MLRRSLSLLRLWPSRANRRGTQPPPVQEVPELSPASREAPPSAGSRAYPPEADDFLRANFATLGPKRCAEEIERRFGLRYDRKRLGNHCRQTLGLIGPGRRFRPDSPYTPEVDVFLRRHFPTRGPQWCAQSLSAKFGRDFDRECLRRHCQDVLGLRWPTDGSPGRPQSLGAITRLQHDLRNQAEALLREHYSQRGPKWCARELHDRFGLTISPHSVRSHATSALGLAPCGNGRGDRGVYPLEVDNFLRRHFTKRGGTWCAREIEQRFGRPCQPALLSMHARGALGLTGPRRARARKSPIAWTAELDLFLLDHFTARGAAYCAREMSRRFAVSLTAKVVEDRACDVLHLAPPRPVRAPAAAAGSAFSRPVELSRPEITFAWKLLGEVQRASDERGGQHVVIRAHDERYGVIRRTVYRLDPAGQLGAPVHTYLLGEGNLREYRSEADLAAAIRASRLPEGLSGLADNK